MDFTNEVIDGVPDGNAVRRRCFLCDNLAAHKNAVVRNAITARGHCLVLRPPYASWGAPIEYFFNVIQQQLAINIHNIDGLYQMEVFINSIILDMGEHFFGPFFVNCGYHV